MRWAERYNGRTGDMITQLGRFRGGEKGRAWRGGSLRERRDAGWDQAGLLLMKVRAAAWYQGWGKGQTCEQMDGEKTCPARVLQTPNRMKENDVAMKGFSNPPNTASDICQTKKKKRDLSKQCVCFCGEAAIRLPVVKGQRGRRAGTRTKPRGFLH